MYKKIIAVVISVMIMALSLFFMFSSPKNYSENENRYLSKFPKFNFDDLIDSLGFQPLGYDNKKEVMIRLARIFPQEAQKALNAVAFFIKPIFERINNKLRPEIERE